MKRVLVFLRCWALFRILDSLNVLLREKGIYSIFIKDGGKNMRIRLIHLIAVLSVLALAAPVWATRTATDLTIDQPAKVQGRLLQPGNYHVIASDEDNQVKFIRDNKVVGEFPAHWINLARKADYSAFVKNGDEIEEIDFEGKDKAINLRQ
jgi:hypothetical protein